MKDHSYPAVVCLGLASLVTTSAASAQCEDSVPFTCDPPGTGRVRYVCTKSGDLACYPAETPPPITPDRRPGFLLQMGCGSCRSCDNPLNHAAWWHNANWTGLQRQLDDAWSQGFRRVVLNKPGGNPGNQKVQQAQYHFLMDKQKALLTQDLGPWLEAARSIDPTFDFGVLVGAWQSGGVCTPCLSSGGGNGYWNCDDDDDLYGFQYHRRFWDPTSLSSMRETYQNLMPWIDVGCSSLWIDNSSNANGNEVGAYKGPQRMLDFVQSPDYAGIRIVGEAIPANRDGYVDTFMAEHAAWCAHLQYLMGDDDGLPPGRGWLTGGSHDDQTVDTATTELNVFFANPDGADDGPPYTIETMADARDRGFIVWTSASEAVPLLQRIYDGESYEGRDLFYEDFMAHHDPADFNGDAKVDCEDFRAFIQNWMANVGRTADPTLAIWDGDLDNDDAVTTNDMLRFLALRNWNSLGCS